MSETMKFETYEEALEAAALAKMEINEIFKPAASRQRKLWKMIFSEKDAGKFSFVKNMMYYQSGVPNEDSKSKMEKIRTQITALAEIMIGMGLEDNFKAYFAEAGIEIDLHHDKYAEFSAFSQEDKAGSLWDLEFFGEKMPSDGKEILKMLMDHAKNTEADIVSSNKEIEADIVEVACAQFDIGIGAFRKAVDLTVIEKNGKNVQDKLDAIEEARKVLDKALEPFTHETE